VRDRVRRDDLKAPAGVYAAGLALTLRDVVQRTLSRHVTIACILISASLSVWISPAFALASGAAFLVSELADMAVFTPLERRSFLGAVVLSNTVGLLVDSTLFLLLAFGSLDLLWGQVLGKGEMTLLAVPVLLVLRQRIPARAVA
jgi:hypothetical protein